MRAFRYSARIYRLAKKDFCIIESEIQKEMESDEAWLIQWLIRTALVFGLRTLNPKLGFVGGVILRAAMVTIVTTCEPQV